MLADALMLVNEILLCVLVLNVTNKSDIILLMTLKYRQKSGIVISFFKSNVESRTMPIFALHIFLVL